MIPQRAANDEYYWQPRCPPHVWLMSGACVKCSRWMWAVFPFER